MANIRRTISVHIFLYFRGSCRRRFKFFLSYRDEMISLETLSLQDYTTEITTSLESLLKAESAEDCRHHAEVLAATLDKAGVRSLK